MVVAEVLENLILLKTHVKNCLLTKEVVEVGVAKLDLYLVHQKKWEVGEEEEEKMVGGLLRPKLPINWN